VSTTASGLVERRRLLLPSRAVVGTAGLVGAVGVVGVAVLAATSGGLALVPASKYGFPDWLAGPLPSPGWQLDGTGVGWLLIALTACWVALLWAGDSLPRRATITAIVVANVLVFLGPPLLSADVFGYVAFARIGAVHHANPYVHGLADVSPDPVRPFARWHNATSPYGALFTLGSYATAPLGVAGALWAFKLFALASSLGLAAVTWRLAESRGLSPASAVAFVALNPLTILFAVGGAHNDLVATALGLLGLGLATRGRAAAGAATIVGAVFIKASGALMLPFAVLAARPRRAALLAAVAAGIAGLVLSVAFLGTHALGFTSALDAQQRLTATHSIPNEVGVLLGFGGLTAGIRIAAGVVLAAAVVLALRATWRGADPFTAAGWVTFAVLVTTAWLVPWYAVWLLPLAALSRDRSLRIATIAVTVAIVAAHVPAIGGVV
jgi:hypothetical protein